LNSGNIGSRRFQHGYTLARLGGDDGDDVDHEVPP
jgi:hypothetical protein